MCRDGAEKTYEKTLMAKAATKNASPIIVAFRRMSDQSLDRIGIEAAGLRIPKDVFVCPDCMKNVVPYDSDPPQFKHYRSNRQCNKSRMQQ